MSGSPRPSAEILALGASKRFSAGTTLFQAGDEAKKFYYLESGAVRVFKTDEQGRELDVAWIEPGDFLGEAVVFHEGRYPFSAEAGRDTAVRVFDKAEVWRGLDRSPAAARFFIGLLARKCVLLSGRVESLGLKTVRQRLAEYLVRNCAGCPGVVELTLTKGELARLLGTVAETLSRTLKQLQEDGLIEVRGREIKVLDCPRLRAEIEPD
ncbi:MAG: Crp/Fnr family transcriptional regulator [Candidatus Aminicenantes bacterium]|nr:Crp/Fnr family transcriptional regulator [Candidatus Aminicenantes bacterium]